MKAKRKTPLKSTPSPRSEITREALIAWLWEAIVTPVSGIDENHRLAQEVTRCYRDGQPIQVRVKPVSKLAATKLLLSMVGWAKPVGQVHEIGGDREAIWKNFLANLGPMYPFQPGRDACQTQGDSRPCPEPPASPAPEQPALRHRPSRAGQ